MVLCACSFSTTSCSEEDGWVAESLVRVVYSILDVGSDLFFWETQLSIENLLTSVKSSSVQLENQERW